MRFNEGHESGRGGRASLQFALNVKAGISLTRCDAVVFPRCLTVATRVTEPENLLSLESKEKPGDFLITNRRIRTRRQLRNDSGSGSVSENHMGESFTKKKCTVMTEHSGLKSINHRLK